LVQANFGFAAALVILLTMLAYLADAQVPAELTVVIVGLSILPAPITLAVLWFDASKSSKQIRDRAERLEQRALEAASDPF
jgi:hypothetical protein